MAYLNGKGYCKKCDRITPHRFSLMVKCLNCGLEKTQKEHNESQKS